MNTRWQALMYCSQRGDKRSIYEDQTYLTFSRFCPGQREARSGEIVQYKEHKQKYRPTCDKSRILHRLFVVGL